MELDFINEALGVPGILLWKMSKTPVNQHAKLAELNKLPVERLRPLGKYKC
jgi:hypothetical protein